ncbi:MAG: class I SAM-dependent methyltransferase [Candidatus Dormiibacterota bacterium]
MNRYHQRLCRSADWADFVAGEMLPAALDGADIGPRVLELGPGYGASTRGLLERTHSLAAVESDPKLVDHLRQEFGPTLDVVLGDATRLPYGDASFSAVVCFTMLHHLPSAEAQDRLFAEVARVLEPGGVFVARDSGGGWRFRLIHLGDICTPVSPRGLRPRLRQAGLQPVEITAVPGMVQFRALRPVESRSRVAAIAAPMAISGAEKRTAGVES